MTERTVSTGGGQCDSEADGPADCEVIFSILLYLINAVLGRLQQKRMIDAQLFWHQSAVVLSESELR